MRLPAPATAMFRHNNNRTGSSQASSSQMSQQTSTQSTRVSGLHNVTAEEREKKVTDLVQYLLVMDQKKIPIKKRDINKIVLKDSAKAFDALMEEASQQLLRVFGFKVVELADKFKGSYILVSAIDNETDDQHLKWSELETAKMGLISIILSMIFMNGEVLEEADLWLALRVLGLSQSDYHNTFGNVKQTITEEFVRQGYLDIKTHTTAEATVKEYRWGQRAALEFRKRNALTLVSDLYKCDPKVWLHQWQQVQEEEGTPEVEVMEVQ